MRTVQMSLLDKCELRYLQNAKELIILVRKLEHDHLSAHKYFGTVLLESSDMQIKDTVFEDIFEQQYVGVRLVQNPSPNDRKTALPIHKTKMSFSGMLSLSINPIKQKIKKMKEHYYAK